MSSIIINISNCKQPGLTSIKRKITIREHVKDYSTDTYTVPYLLEHFDASDNKVALVPDVNYTLIADNTKRIWIGPGGVTSREYVAGWTEMGLYDFFQNLQKTYSDTQILTGEISRLDGIGFFDPVVEGPDPVLP